jgi:hypothetical protein
VKQGDALSPWPFSFNFPGPRKQRIRIEGSMLKFIYWAKTKISEGKTQKLC